MKNLFEQETLNEVISRIDKLQPVSERQWGKMDAAQMMAHCSITMDIASGRLNLPRIFIGRLIAPFIKSIYTNEKPFAKNGPTGKELVVAGQRDFAVIMRREKLYKAFLTLALIDSRCQTSDTSCSRTNGARRGSKIAAFAR